MPGKELFRTSLRSFTNNHMPNDGCILLFGVKRGSLAGSVYDNKMLSMHKISTAKLPRGEELSTPCDLYICWKDGKDA